LSIQTTNTNRLNYYAYIKQLKPCRRCGDPLTSRELGFTFVTSGQKPVRNLKLQPYANMFLAYIFAITGVQRYAKIMTKYFVI